MTTTQTNEEIIVPTERIEQQIAMAEHRGLGKAGRAGRVLNVDRVVGREGGAQQVDVGLGRAAAAEDGGESGRPKRRTRKNRRPSSLLR